MLKSAFQNHFAQIPQVQGPRSSFKRPSRHKHTFDEGYLVPFYLDDVIPGDTFNIKAGMFARLATPIFPYMDRMYMETFWFFVPCRLVWENFVKQHGERVNPDDTVDYTTPVIDDATISTPAVGSLWDNFGLPMQGAQYLDKVSALPFRMYNMIWNEWFRDQDLQPSVPFDIGDGPDNLADYTLLRINKYKDYFTIARPEPQKGPAVSLPLGTSADVTGTFRGPNSVNTPSAIFDSWTGGYAPSGKGVDDSTATWTANSVNSTGSRQTVNQIVNIDSQSLSFDLTQPGAMNTLVADLSTAVGPTVNALRELITVQQVYELDMRGGTRFIEMIFNHYGVVNPDFRLQRPEFLGYRRSDVNVHPVPQTGETDGTPQGNLAAFGTSSSHGNGFVHSFTEFGYVIGLVVVRADQTYQYGLDRHWSRQVRFDYYYPTFANLGEMAILNQELWTNPAAATGNEAVFGYQEAWADYRYKTSKVTGLFRSTAAASLDAWGLWQEYASLPALDSAFIQEDAPVDRIIAVPAEPHFIFDCIVENITSRRMPVYSVPGLLRL